MVKSPRIAAGRELARIDVMTRTISIGFVLFIIAVAAAGAYFIFCRAPATEPIEFDDGSPGDGARGQVEWQCPFVPDREDDREAPRTVEPLRPDLPTCSYAGKVVDEKGSPVEGAALFLFGTGGGAARRENLFAGREARTDRAGAYVFEYVPAVGSYLVGGAVRGAAFCEVHCPAPEAGRIVTVADLVLRRGLIRKGTVVDLDGRPLEGVRIAARSEWEFLPRAPIGYSRSEAVTDDAGRFVLSGLSPGEYEVTAEAEGYIPRCRPMLVDRHGSGGHATGSVDFALARGVRILRGRVESDDGLPLAGAIVGVKNSESEGRSRLYRTARTDGGGAFVVENLPAGTLTLTAESEAFYLDAPVGIDPDQDAVAVSMAAKGRIEARIEASAPLPEAFGVGVHEFIAEGEIDGAQAFRDIMFSSGTISLDRLIPGIYVLVVKADGFAWAFSDEIDVESGETARDVIITLSKGGAIAGRLVDDRGRYARGFEVRLMPADHDGGGGAGRAADAVCEQGKRVLSTEEGMFAMPHVLPGSYCLEIIGTGMPPLVRGPLKVEDGKELLLDPIVVMSGGRLEGRAFRSGGEPARGARIVAVKKGSGHCRTAATGEDGGFSFDALAAGVYLVHIEADAWTDPRLRSTKSVLIREGETAFVEVTER